MRTFRYVVADVFTDTPLAGNQLAVFTDARGLDDATMQALALEIGFSEIGVRPPARGRRATSASASSRRTFELPFAGHPTLGTAFVLGAPLQLGVITLETGTGDVPVVLERDESGQASSSAGWSSRCRRSSRSPDADGLLEALGVESAELPGRAVRQRRHASSSSHSARRRRSPRCEPDLAAIVALGVTGVSCFAGAGDRWTTRMFWQGGEDAATGSAAGPVACHLARHGRIAWGDEIAISQGAAIGRPSTLYARAEGGDGLIDRVEVGGQAVTVARGEFRCRSARARRPYRATGEVSLASRPRCRHAGRRSPVRRGARAPRTPSRARSSGARCPSGETLSTTSGRTWATASAASSSETPSCAAIFASSSSPTTLRTSAPLIGSFSPVPTHESACAVRARSPESPREPSAARRPRASRRASAGAIRAGRPSRPALAARSCRRP